jgi:PTS system N-acetylgalactosamine-specific IIA component
MFYATIMPPVMVADGSTLQDDAMLTIILTGHGGFASGLEKAMLQIVGTQSQFVAIDFPETSSTLHLTEQFECALNALDKSDGIVFLTDLLGGTPFRVASTLAIGNPSVEVITGTNLQLLLEMILERDGLDSETFRQQALVCGHRGLTSLADELLREREMLEPENGI